MKLFWLILLSIYGRLSGTFTPDPQVEKWCNEAAVNRNSSAEIIQNCANYDVPSVPNGKLIFDDSVSLNEIRAFLAQKTRYDYSLTFANREMMTLLFPNAVKEQIVIKGDLEIRNTKIGTFPFFSPQITDPIDPLKSNEAKIRVEGKLIVHENRFLLTPTDIMKVIEVKDAKDIDIQEEGECIIGSPVNDIFKHSDDTYGLKNCRTIIGDLVLNTHTKLPSISIIKLDGCLQIDGWRQIDLSSDEYGKNEFSQLLHKAIDTHTGTCKKNYLRNVCARKKNAIRFLVKFGDAALENINCEKEKIKAKLYCDEEDLKYLQWNCERIHRAIIGPGFDPTILSQLGKNLRFDGLSVRNFDNETLDLSGIEQIGTPYKTHNYFGVRYVPLEIINNPKLKQIIFSPTLQLLSDELKCTTTQVIFKNNPAYKWSIGIRNFLRNLAKDGCQHDKDGVNYDIPKLNVAAPKYVAAEPMVAMNYSINVTEQQNTNMEIFEVDKEEEAFDFWSSHPLYILPLVTVLICCAIFLPIFLIKMARNRRMRRMLADDMQLANASGEELVFPWDLSKSGYQLNEHQKRQVFKFIKNIFDVPVLQLRMMVAKGLPEVAEKQSIKDKTISEKTVEENESEEVYFRYRLAKEVRDNTVMPVYDCPDEKDLKLLHRRRASRREADRIALQRPENFSTFCVYEISPRFPAHKNENKFREIFDIWANEAHEFYVVFGVGDALHHYCNRCFELSLMKPPLQKSESPLTKLLNKFHNFETCYYHCEYRSEKMRYDRPRSFIIEFHRLKTDGMDATFTKPFIEAGKILYVQFMFIAMQLQVPVITNYPIVFFMLKMIHTAFFYMFKRKQETSKTDPSKIVAEAVLQAGIEMALDEMELSGLYPPNVIHIFTRQMLAFCRSFLEIESKSYPAMYDYHFPDHNKQSKKNEMGTVKQIQDTLAAYEYANKLMDDTYQTHVKEGENMIHWQSQLPFEELNHQQQQSVQPEKIIYRCRQFLNYYHELQPSYRILKIKQSIRSAQSARRQKKIHKLVKERLKARGVATSNSDKERS